jgi:hypothetical protein
MQKALFDAEIPLNARDYCSHMLLPVSGSFHLTCRVRVSTSISSLSRRSAQQAILTLNNANSM